jgi:hypothetical protein
MPQDSTSLDGALFLRSLFMGEPKAGKTVTLIKSAVETFGPGYVIECSSREHMRTAQMLTEGKPWQFDVVKSQEEFDGAIKAARAGVKDGKYKWILVDDFNVFSDRMESAMQALYKAGYTAYQQLNMLLQNSVLRLFDIPDVHIMFTMHYTEVSEALIEGQIPKKGRGIVPCLVGKSRSVIPGHFNQVILFQKNRSGERVFGINPEGVWGIGIQGGKAKDTTEIPADLNKLMEVLRG